ncbi:MAG: GxxExxY protein [Candidatus Aureabacteria bacterium]|nr:GxxExxY protein [Candidatus Auribacterota bacterium]
MGTDYQSKGYPHSELTEKILGCSIEVHKTLGPGFLEQIYESALIQELQSRSIPVEAQVPILIRYKNRVIAEYRLDLVVENTVIVENKAVTSLNDIHLAQVLSYLKASGMKIGLLINYAKTKIEVKRIIL